MSVDTNIIDLDITHTMITAVDTRTGKRKQRPLIRIRPDLYRRGNKIYARVWVGNKRTFRSTGTNAPSIAERVLEKFRNDETLRQNGVNPDVAALERKKITVGKLIDDYVAAGYPDSRMRPKKSSTRDTERKTIERLRPFLGDKIAATLTLADCDDYRDWRCSGGFKYERQGKMCSRTVGYRVVDVELQTLGNILGLGVRRRLLRANPLEKRTRYHREEDTRHCREVSPDPPQLKQIEKKLRENLLDVIADVILFLAFSGLRVNEALQLRWSAVDWDNKVIFVRRQKRGINPWVPILPEMENLLEDMKARSTKARSTRDYLFRSPVDPNQPIAYSNVAGKLRSLCRSSKMKYVTCHGMRSYFVTQCRQSGLTEAEIAMLIGDKTVSIISTTYGDVRPDHLLEQAKRVRLLASTNLEPRELCTGSGSIGASS